jgi:hypothetical protein
MVSSCHATASPPNVAIALQLESALRDEGLLVVGPASTARDAANLVEEGEFDAAVIDLGLTTQERAYTSAIWYTRQRAEVRFDRGPLDLVEVAGGGARRQLSANRPRRWLRYAYSPRRS